MRKKTISKAAMSVLALVLILTMLLPSDLALAAAKKNQPFISYRVDVLDSSISATTKNLAVEFCSSMAGTAYVYAAISGTEKFSTAAAVASACDSVNYPVEAGKESRVYGRIDWLEKWNFDKTYDVFIAFKDAKGKYYGPYKDSFKPRYFPAGNGTKNNPYEIWSDVHLKNLSTLHKEEGVYVKLMQDIDMKGSAYTERIMGYASEFFGTFDGNKKTILNMNGELFDDIAKSATVKNLFFYNCSSTFQGILADNVNGTVENCAILKSSVDNPSTDETGLFCGVNKGTIKNCKVVDSSVLGNAECGGIAGCNSGILQNCYSNATVANKRDSGPCGGITGSLGSISSDLTPELIGCYYEAPKKNCLSSKTIGGLAGNYSRGNITDCVSTFTPDSCTDFPGKGSICGYVREQFEATSYGAVTETPTPPESTEDKKAIDAFTDYLAAWKCYHGLTLEEGDSRGSLEKKEGIYKPINPVTGKVATKAPKTTGFKGIGSKMKKKLPCETKAYNKKFKAVIKKVSIKP